MIDLPILAELYPSIAILAIHSGQYYIDDECFQHSNKRSFDTSILRKCSLSSCLHTHSYPIEISHFTSPIFQKTAIRPELGTNWAYNKFRNQHNDYSYTCDVDVFVGIHSDNEPIYIIPPFQELFNWVLYKSFPLARSVLLFLGEVTALLLMTRP